jgi:hypothetical protein
MTPMWDFVEKNRVAGATPIASGCVSESDLERLANAGSVGWRRSGEAWVK